MAGQRAAKKTGRARKGTQVGGRKNVGRIAAERSENGIVSKEEDRAQSAPNEELEVESESDKRSSNEEEVISDDLSQKEGLEVEQEVGEQLSDSGDSDSASEDDDESEDDGESEDGDDFPRKKKAKLSKHDDGSAGFSSALNAILGSHLKAHDRKDPIMARKKVTAKKLENDKLEQKAKRAMLAEKKKLLNKTRTKDIIPSVSAENESGTEIREVLEKERRLRKIAQKGVVKLFNAILSTQVKSERDGAERIGDVKNRTEKKELLTEISKEKFLDLVKAAGDS
ncbi:LADA_0B04786g1_1 [Lachancea dasiensis]|uniref:LADA_0B04786g1_1 n=1 Tax=Lachancea dasiensis TaxID=1072105 RepID=A0A1G4IT51_9SACH|nr:LADA_0B04786g1_1 [Lachancea dasiensis]